MHIKCVKIQESLTKYTCTFILISQLVLSGLYKSIKATYKFESCRFLKQIFYYHGGLQDTLTSWFTETLNLWKFVGNFYETVGVWIGVKNFHSFPCKY